LKVVRKHIESISETEKKQIDELIELNGGTVFHETRFNIIASNTFKTKLTYFLAFNNNELIGICPCHTLKDRCLYLSYSNLASYEIPYGGWIYNKDVSVKELLMKTNLRLNESLMYASNIQIDKDADNYFNKIKQIEQNTVILNLSPSVEQLFDSKLNSQLRKKIRKAVKLGITVDKIKSEDFNVFLDLFAELKTKAGLKQRNNNYYQQVMSEYEKQGKAVCLAAKYNNEYISAMILLANKFITIAWVGGRKIGIPNNLYQNELLIWEAIKWAKEFGSKYFDLSGLNETKLPHLARIKLSFSKDIVPFYSFAKNSLYFKIINRMQNVFLRSEKYQIN
jgi:lipid II:glycine glycyltransferase (peptidoglycan interpeptide bridge formation enzyme)